MKVFTKSNVKLCASIVAGWLLTYIGSSLMFQSRARSIYGIIGVFLSITGVFVLLYTRMPKMELKKCQIKK